MTSNLLGLIASLSVGAVGAPADSADINAYLAARAAQKDPLGIELQMPNVLQRGPLDFSEIVHGDKNNQGQGYSVPNQEPVSTLPIPLPSLDDIREPQKDDSSLVKPITLSKGWDLDLMFQFMYLPKLERCKALEERLDVTRTDFTGSMGEEFGKQLQIGDQFASIGLLARLTSPWGFTSGGHATFLFSIDYSSSSIFGEIKSKKDYLATLLDGKIELGNTTTIWNQNLNHHLALLAGVGYEWNLVKVKNFELGVEISARAGATYMEFSTLLDLFVHPTDKFELFGYDIAAQLDVYRHRFTESKGNAWGVLGRFEGALQLRIWKGLAIDIGGGLQQEHYPNFHMNVTEYSGGFPDQPISEYTIRKNPIEERDDVGNIDNNINPMERNGWYTFVRLGWTFQGIFGTKEIETEKGNKSLYVPIQYLTPATTK